MMICSPQGTDDMQDCVLIFRIDTALFLGLSNSVPSRICIYKNAMRRFYIQPLRGSEPRYSRLSADSLAREKRDGGYIKVVIVVVIGGVDNVENSKMLDAVWLFRHFFINISSE